MNETKYTIVGHEIKRIRKDKGIKRCDFAKQIGICDRHMGRIENTGQILSLELIKKIAIALDVSVMYLAMLALNDYNNVSQEQLSIVEDIIQTIFDKNKQTKS